MELGIYTFGDLVQNVKTGRTPSPYERMVQMLEMAKIADESGLDIFGVGEHHSLRFVNSATATTIAAMAALTKRIKFTSSTTQLSTADPVRTFQEFATADLVSNGRVEVIFGRGAYRDNFHLFGFDIKDYDDLFLEKLLLFEQINSNERIPWNGKYRSALSNAEVAPRPVQQNIPVWIGAGSAASITRAAAMGYPVAIPVLGHSITHYGQIAALYQNEWIDRGHEKDDFKLAIFSHLHVGKDSQKTISEFFPHYSAYLGPLFQGPMPASMYNEMCSPSGALFFGSPQQVIDKIMLLKETTGMTRYVGQIDIGGQSFADVAKGIELFVTKVAPVVNA